MFRNRKFVPVFALGMSLSWSACGSNADSPAPGTPVPDASEQPASGKARVKGKAPALLANDLAQALDIPRSELCTELSTYDCFQAHQIVLGGVEPYRLRIDEPLAGAAVASPLAADRIALSACGERAARDFAAANAAVLFAEVAGTGTAPDPSARRAVARRLYERLLARPGAAAEIDALVAFYDELAGSTNPEASQTWAQLSCYAVATSTEFLFY